MKKIIVVAVCLVQYAVFSISIAAEVIEPPPGNPDPGEKYLFYLHGISVELHGPDSWSDTFGKTYEYTKIVQHLVSRGYNVVSEARPEGTVPLKYAIKTADEIEQMLDAGVPGKNIAVIGHSRGAFMSLLIRPRVRDPDVSIVALAGCAQPDTDSVAGVNPRAGYNRFLAGLASNLHGRFLSVYDSSDEWFGTCREAFDIASRLDAKEMVLETGEGHGLFYDPDPAWVEPVMQWIGW